MKKVKPRIFSIYSDEKTFKRVKQLAKKNKESVSGLVNNWIMDCIDGIGVAAEKQEKKVC